MNRATHRRNALGIVPMAILAIGIALASVSDALARWGGGGGGWGGGGGGGFHGFGGGGGEGGGGGFHGFGGDGFGGGSMSHSYSGSNSWDHSSSGSGYNSFENKSGNTYNSYKSPAGSGSSYGGSSNKSADYNTYNANQEAQQQANYNEANSLQHNQEATEETMHNDTLTTVNNNVGDTNYNGGNPYGNCCSDGGGSDTGEVLGAAALGAVGGMAVGSMMTSAAQSQAPTTTIIQNAPPYGYPSAPPPLGTTLYALPPGAYATSVNGSTYYYAGSTYYRSYFNGSQVVYIATNPY
jgi:hypothetical protein